MTAREKEKVTRLLTAVSEGLGDRSGCNDGDATRATDWTDRFFGTRIGQGFDALVDDITESVGYGG